MLNYNFNDEIDIKLFNMYIKIFEEKGLNYLTLLVFIKDFSYYLIEDIKND